MLRKKQREEARKAKKNREKLGYRPHRERQPRPQLLTNVLVSEIKDQEQENALLAAAEWKTPYRRALLLSLGEWTDDKQILDNYRLKCTAENVKHVCIKTREELIEFLQLQGPKADSVKEFLADFQDEQDVILLNSHGSKTGDSVDLHLKWGFTPEMLAKFVVQACPKDQHLKVKNLSCYGGRRGDEKELAFCDRLVNQIATHDKSIPRRITVIGSEDEAKVGWGHEVLVEDNVKGVRYQYNYVLSKKIQLLKLLEKESREERSHLAQKALREMAALCKEDEYELEVYLDGDDNEGQFTEHESLQFYCLIEGYLHGHFSKEFSDQVKQILKNDFEFLFEHPQFKRMLRPEWINTGILEVIHKILNLNENLRDPYLYLLYAMPESFLEIEKIMDLFHKPVTISITKGIKATKKPDYFQIEHQILHFAKLQFQKYLYQPDLKPKIFLNIKAEAEKLIQAENARRIIEEKHRQEQLRLQQEADKLRQEQEKQRREAEEKLRQEQLKLKQEAELRRLEQLKLLQEAEKRKREQEEIRRLEEKPKKELAYNRIYRALYVSERTIFKLEKETEREKFAARLRDCYWNKDFESNLELFQKIHKWGCDHSGLKLFTSTRYPNSEGIQMDNELSISESRTARIGRALRGSKY